MATGQLVTAVFGLATAAFFVFVGHRLRSYPTSIGGRPAMLAFGGYWSAVGVAAALSVARVLLGAAFDPAPDLLLRVLFVVGDGALLAGVALFTYYLAFVFTGSLRTALAAFAVYAVFGAGQLVFVASAFRPAETQFRQPFYATDANAFLPQELAFILAVAPVALGTVGLMWLGFRTRMPSTQYRATLVGGALLTWTLSSAVGYTVHMRGAWELAPEVVAFGAALAVYLAYFPPPKVQRELYDRDLRATPPVDA